MITHHYRNEKNKTVGIGTRRHVTHANDHIKKCVNRTNSHTRKASEQTLASTCCKCSRSTHERSHVDVDRDKSRVRCALGPVVADVADYYHHGHMRAHHATEASAHTYNMNLFLSVQPLYMELMLEATVKMHACTRLEYDKNCHHKHKSEHDFISLAQPLSMSWLSCGLFTLCKCAR